MIRQNYKKQLLSLLIVLLNIGCSDSDDKAQPNAIDGIFINETLTLSFDNVVGSQELVLSEQTYTNLSGENYNITELKYIISNIRLTQTDGTVFTYPIDESFFVIDENDPGSLQINLTGIPAGRYRSLNFGFGVDQTRYPIAQGTLNFVPTAEEKGMLWAWAAGYKFLKMEGDFRASGSDISELFTYHVGSLSNTLDNYKEILLNFPSNLGSESTRDVTIIADISNVFDATNTLSLLEKADVQIDPENSPLIAENISTMFRIKS